MTTSTSSRLTADARAICVLAAPLVGNNLSILGMQFADTVMAGQLGARDLAALSVGVGFYHLFLLTGLGVLMAVSPSVAHAFARQAEVARVLEHRPHTDVAERCSFQPITFDQRRERGRQHVLVARFGVGTHRARERDARAADDGDPAHCRSDEHDGLAVREWRPPASMPVRPSAGQSKP